MKTNNLSIGGQITTMFSHKFGLLNLFHLVCLQQTDAKQKSSDTLKEDVERKQGNLTLQSFLHRILFSDQIVLFWFFPRLKGINMKYYSTVTAAKSRKTTPYFFIQQ